MAEEMSLREALEGAFDESEEEEKGSAELEPSPKAEEPEPQPEPEKAEEPEPSPEPEPEPTAAKEGEPESEVKPEPSPEPEEEATGALEPPQSWKNEAKETWKDLPPVAQEEALRREREITKTLEETAQARQFLGEMQKIVAPYQGYFQAQGVQPLQAIQNTLSLANTLQTGDQNTKAATVARIINDFGVDIKTLDGVLANGAPAAPNGQPGQAIDPNSPLAKEVAEMRQYIAAQQQQQQTTVQGETQKFLEANPLANEVRNEMADFMDVAQAQGRQLTLDEAFKMALATRPELQQRHQREQTAGQTQDKVNKSRAASVSIPQKPEPSTTPAKPTTLRGTIEEAWDQAG